MRAALIVWILILLPPQLLLAQEFEPLVIETSQGERSFMVEYAGTNESRSRGLMFRQSLENGHGMIFHYEKPRPVFMWMRNTLISLDMLFIDETGIIRFIAHETVPLSENAIGPNEPILAVLEIGGGEAKALGIEVGDKVRHPIFD